MFGGELGGLGELGDGCGGFGDKLGVAAGGRQGTKDASDCSASLT